MAVIVGRTDGAPFEWGNKTGYVDNYDLRKVGRTASSINVFRSNNAGFATGQSQAIPGNQIEVRPRPDHTP